MERLQPLKPTFERDEIEKRINKLYEEKAKVISSGVDNI